VKVLLRRSLIAISILSLLGVPIVSRGAEPPFEIYTIEPTTGPGAFVGQEAIKALAAVEAYVNKNGGIRGRPIKIVVRDDQTNPQIAVQIMSQYLEKKPAIIVGGLFNATCYAAAALLKDDGPVLYCYAPGVRTTPWIYTTGYAIPWLVGAGVRYFRERGLTKVAMLTTNDANGQDTERGIGEVLAHPENQVMTVTTREHMALGDISIAAQIQKIKGSGAQACICWVAGTPFLTFLRGFRDAGMQIPVLTSNANISYSQLESYKAVWPDAPIHMVGFPALVPDAVPDRRVRGAVDRFTTAMRAGGITRPESGDAITWDMMLVIVDAYRHLGFDATATQMRDYINGIRNWSGIYGHMDYQASPQRGVLPEWTILVRWDPETAKFVAVSKPGGAPLK
jgi:branched-chain amino acid transport system substrate-binding protein